MNLIKNNPYRTLGLLAGASAREVSKQANRLQKIIAAEQEPSTDDFSFPALGNLKRTTESIEESNSKLNLDSDKMNAALFWFWNGNPITDEVAFDALKEGNVEKAYQIWDKLIVETQEDGKRYWRTVSEKNSSAFHNCFVLEMLRTNGNKHNAIVANLYFLESEFSQKFISTITDSTHRTNSKEMQINFLNEILQETEQGNINLILSKFVSILNSVNFIAKADFLKSISQKFTSNISAQIETSKKKRLANKANAVKAGEELYQQTKNDLEQLKSIVGLKDFSYTTIADKLANEILQCSIDYFNEAKALKASNNFLTIALNLANLAEKIAVGSVAKGRIKENLTILEEMKDREILEAIEVLKSVKNAYDINTVQIYAEVRKQEATLGYGQSINWGKVNEMIENSINWNKAIDLAKQTIPTQNIEKIKNTKNQTQLNEYKELVNFLMGKVNYSRKKEIKYLAYWDNSGYEWYDNPRSWKDFGGWWWADTNTGDAQLNGCLGILLLPFNLVFGVIYILYRAVAGILAEVNKK